MRKKELAAEVIERLKKEYPVIADTLNHEEAWKLLVGLRLAAQCTDKRVEQVTPVLFARYPDPASLGKADEEDVEKIIHSCGLSHSKARDITACMKMLHETYHDVVPDTMEELLKLPGVGRKSANLILGDVYHKPAIVTDTHCIRLCGLIGLTDEKLKEPYQVEKALWKIIPPEEGNDFCHRLVLHGRAVCIANRPNCAECILNDLCRHGKQVMKKQSHL